MRLGMESYGFVKDTKGNSPKSSRCDRNKLDATAGLEVSDPTNEIDSSKEAAEIASAVRDKVSLLRFRLGPGTAGASFTSDDDLIHRTRGGRLIKPSLKGDRANLGSRNQEKVLSEINGTHFSPCLAGILEGPYVLGRPVSQRNTKAVVEDADGDAERVKNMGKESITDDMKSFGVKIKRQNLGYFTIGFSIPTCPVKQTLSLVQHYHSKSSSSRLAIQLSLNEHLSHKHLD
ncbi:hypothetical protein F2Q68_00011441 [Brassica cretica]|uniref:Uncharacterized protein n=1 Tax=Brassica cretica TaxID=69181 RepID=A0A8S9KN61_BRACR|nr:hypothetical protein F2Q68_00011441 [Brassica cretica]